MTAHLQAELPPAGWQPMSEAPTNRLEGEKGYNPFLGPIIEAIYEDGTTALVAWQSPQEHMIEGYMDSRVFWPGFQALELIPQTTNPDEIHLLNECEPPAPVGWRPITKETLHAYYRAKYGADYVAEPPEDGPAEDPLLGEGEAR